MLGEGAFLLARALKDERRHCDGAIAEAERLLRRSGCAAEAELVIVRNSEQVSGFFINAFDCAQKLTI